MSPYNANSNNKAYMFGVFGYISDPGWLDWYEAVSSTHAVRPVQFLLIISKLIDIL